MERNVKNGAETIEAIREKKGFMCDMDGVIYHGEILLPGVREFVDWLESNGKSFLFLTNSSERSPLELRQRLQRMGLDVSEEHFYTSALATAKFLSKQSPGCTAYIVGASGLQNAFYDVGISHNDVNPDYVVIGETRSYNYDTIVRATTLVFGGAKLIATNPDTTGPSEEGIVPACKAYVAPIEIATKRTAYYVGKPNPLMMRTGLRMLGVHSEDAVMVGDRMDTDIIAGIETGIDTVLVMTGVTRRKDMKMFPYSPTYILKGVGEIGGYDYSSRSDMPNEADSSRRGRGVGRKS
ncbi:MAG: HAD-IIA family hydrolase [Clostridiales Family XIII bacterium]|jgi:NagD protein|nr:HAD-IIA family hydrolase [Clostridiales Family XIII bacterium]